jgi:hypothetical protein
MIEYVLPGLALMALAVTGYAGLLLREHGMVHMCFVLSAWFRALGEAEEHRQRRFAFHRPERGEEVAR